MKLRVFIVQWTAERIIERIRSIVLLTVCGLNFSLGSSLTAIISSSISTNTTLFSFLKLDSGIIVYLAQYRMDISRSKRESQSRFCGELKGRKLTDFDKLF